MKLKDHFDKMDLDLVSRLLKLDGDNWTVDWKGINDVAMKKGYEPLYDKIISFLIEASIFDTKPNGNYFLIGDSIFLNPSTSMANLYFKERKDAENFKEGFYSDTKYTVYLCRVLDTK